MDPALEAMQLEVDEVSTQQEEATNDSSAPQFQSRLQAKREERRRQKQLQEQQQQEQLYGNGEAIEIREPEEFVLALQSATPAVGAATIAKRGQGPETNGNESDVSHTAPSTYPGFLSTARDANAGEDAEAHRRQRADARRAVLAFDGSIWEAVESNALEIVENYILLEGTQSLLRKRHPKSEQAGRTLLHCAAWCGHHKMTQYLLSVGSDPNSIDTVWCRTSNTWSSTDSFSCRL